MTAPYGRPHVRAKAAALAAMPDGWPCVYCRLPMYRWQRLDFDHVIPLILGGRPDGERRLTHARCNRSAGARLGNRRRARRTRRVIPRPRWLLSGFRLFLRATGDPAHCPLKYLSPHILGGQDRLPTLALFPLKLLRNSRESRSGPGNLARM